MNNIPIRIIPGTSPAAVIDMSDGLGLTVIRFGSFMVVLTDETKKPEPSKEELCHA